MKTVKISYEEFCKIRQSRYSIDCIKFYACKHLGCKPEDIDDIDWNFKLTFDVYLKPKEEELIDESLPF